MQSAAPSSVPAAASPREAQQLRLGISLPDGRHLIPLETCYLLLDLDEDSVLGEIERGDLGWAWDIRSTNSERREIRVWRTSLLSRLNGVDRTGQLPLDEVVGAILPGRDVRLMELARWFACSGSHVSNLIREGSLALATDRPRHSSAAAVTRVTRESVLWFLRERRVT